MDPQDQASRGVLERRRSPIGLADAAAFQRHPLRTLIRGQRAHGDLFELTSFFGGRMLVVATPELAAEVLQASAGCYLAGVGNRRVLPVLPKDTLLTLDGAEHRRRRRMVAPLFSGGALDALTPAVDRLVAEHADRWPVGRPFAALPRTRSLSLSVAARIILGIEDESGVAELRRHLDRALRPYSMLSGRSVLARLGPLSPDASGARGRWAFARGLDRIGRDAHHRIPPGRCDHEPAGGALPSDEVLALLLAAHETIATALAWAMTLLATSPEVVDAVAQAASDARQPWLDAIIWEVLRIRPPLVDIPRQAAQDVRLGDRVLPAGTLLLLPPPLIHHNARQAEPDRFMPARYLSARPDPRTWLPFGGGARRCLGASLAMRVLRSGLSEILRRFVLIPVRPTAERAVLYGTALIPVRGGEVMLRRRHRDGP